MPMDPPQTPWVGLPRFQDESLLLNAQPIFEDSFDSTKGDGLDDWAGNTPRSSTMKVMDNSLDLEDYLPEEDEQSRPDMSISKTMSVSDAKEESRQLRPIEKNNVQLQGITQHITHKREGSHSLIPIAGPSKKTKPPIPREKNDDLYSRRLSDSIRRSSSTNLHDIHSSLQVSQASSSRLPKPKETASSRLKASLHTSVVAKEKREARGFGAHGYIQKHTTSARIPQIPEKTKTSALSRYLAKSNALQPSLSQDKTSTTELLTANENEQMPNQISTQQLQDTKDDNTFTSHRHHSPFSLASTISEVSSSHTQTSDRSEPVRESSSRRSSMSEKVVGFFSNLLTRSVSSSSLRDEVSAAENEEEEAERGEDTVKMDQDQDGTVKPYEIEEEHDEANTITSSSGTQPPNPIASTHHPNHPRRVVPLTRSIPFSRPLHIHTQPRSLNGTIDSQAKESVLAKPKPRPLQPSRATNVSSLSSSNGKFPSSASSSTDHEKPARPITNSAFVSAALAKLPPPGKGHSFSLSNQPIVVKPIERVKDLKERKNVFERFATSSTSTSGTVNSAIYHPKPSKAMKGSNLTIPIRGHTPGKASNTRLAQRAKFDAIVQEKQREKERIAEEQRRQREEQEEEEYMRRRKETVVWARPVPEMYKR